MLRDVLDKMMLLFVGIVFVVLIVSWDMGRNYWYSVFSAHESLVDEMVFEVQISQERMLKLTESEAKTLAKRVIRENKDKVTRPHLKEFISIRVWDYQHEYTARAIVTYDLVYDDYDIDMMIPLKKP